MDDKDLTAIAEKVSVLMQLDRTRHHVGTDIDMAALANVPAYIASVFEEANRASGPMSPEDLYALVNKRVSQVQAQIYLMRVELENRWGRDPARIYDDPMAISAYGERLEATTRTARSFGFEPSVLAFGWYPTEQNDDGMHRWMRPGDMSVACVPHLGAVDQVIEIAGYVLAPEQLEDLAIRAGGAAATIAPDAPGGRKFTARLDLKAAALRSANYLPVEFVLTDFRQPNAIDTRLLGANIWRFTCRPATGPTTAPGGHNSEEDPAGS